MPAWIPVAHVQLGELDGLPPEEPGVGLIVSRMVADAAPRREDLFVPHQLVRDESGDPVGCRALAQVVKTARCYACGGIGVEGGEPCHRCEETGYTLSAPPVAEPEKVYRP